MPFAPVVPVATTLPFAVSVTLSPATPVLMSIIGAVWSVAVADAGDRLLASSASVGLGDGATTVNSKVPVETSP